MVNLCISENRRARRPAAKFPGQFMGIQADGIFGKRLPGQLIPHNDSLQPGRQAVGELHLENEIFRQGVFETFLLIQHIEGREQDASKVFIECQTQGRIELAEKCFTIIDYQHGGQQSAPVIMV